MKAWVFNITDNLTSWNFCTGKSLSEALIFASTNPQYDDILFITSSLHENSKLRTWGEHVVYINCSECQYKNLMNNMSSYCGLFDAKISDSDKDLPVLT